MIVQAPGGVALNGMVPPVMLTEVAVFAIVPLHWGEAGVPKTVRLAGRVSVKFTPVKFEPV